MEKLEKKDITNENALLLVKFNPERALEIAEIIEKKGWYEKIPKIFELAPADTLQFIYRHPEHAADLAPLIREKIDEIINIIDLPRDQLKKLGLEFPDKILSISRINSGILPEMFYDAMQHASIIIKTELAKNHYNLIRTKISEVGQEFPDKIVPILKQVNDFRNKCNEAEEIIISTAIFFPQKAVEIALAYGLELKIAIEVPSVAAKIAIEKPELAFEIMEAAPESVKEIREHYTIKKN